MSSATGMSMGTFGTAASAAAAYPGATAGMNGRPAEYDAITSTALSVRHPVFKNGKDCLPKMGDAVARCAAGTPAASGTRSEGGLNMAVRADSLEQSFTNLFGALGAEHPMARYVGRLASEVFDSGTKVKVVITSHWDEINALALPNGTIILSDRLVRFCRHEEELRFVLAHEYQHIARGHAAKDIEFMEQAIRDGMQLSFFLLTLLGRKRVSEYEGDFRGYLGLGQKGINPYGGTVFFNRMAALGNGKDMAHGSSIDRVLNLGLVTRLYDIAALTTNLTPIPDGIRDMPVAQGKTDHQVLVTEGVIEVGGRFEIAGERHDRAGAASLSVLMGALPAISERLNGHYEKGERSKPSTLDAMRIDEDEKIVAEMLRRIRREINALFPTRSKADRARIAAMAIEAGGDAGLFNISDKRHPLYGLADEFVETLDTAEDFMELRGIMTSETFERMSIYLTANPEKLLERIAEAALEADVFAADDGRFDASGYFAFCREWVDNIRELADHRGRYRPDRKTALQRLVLLGCISLGKGQKVAEYLEEAVGATGLSRGGLMAAAVRRKLITSIEKGEGSRTAGSWEEGILSSPLIAAKAFVAATMSRNREAFESELASAVFEYGKDLIFLDDVFNLLFEGAEPSFLDGVPKIERLKFLLAAYVRLKIEPPHHWEQHAEGSFQDLTDILGILAEGGSIMSRKAVSPFSAYSFNVLTRKIKTTGKRGFVRKYLALPMDMTGILAGCDPASQSIFLNALFEEYEFDLADKNDLKFLYLISRLIPDALLGMRLRKRVTGQLPAACAPEELFNLMFVDRRFTQTMPLAVRKEHIDRHVNAMNDLARLQRCIEEMLDVSPEPAHGKLVIMDMLENQFRGKQALLRVLMATRSDDTELRGALFSAYRLRQTNDDEPAEAAETMREVDDAVHSIYRLDGIAVHALVRNLLVGEKGVLTTRRGRSWLLSHLFDNVVRGDVGDTALTSILRVGLAELMERSDTETLFFAVAPIIEARIIKPPPSTRDWAAVLEVSLEEADPLRDKMEETIKAYNAAPPDAEKKFTCEIDGELSELLEYKVTDTARLTVGHETVVKRIIGEDAVEGAEETISPLKFVLEVASKLGSPGVRFLQILGQFVEIPPEYEAEFAKVYDGMEGQTKLTAYMVLMREWPDAAGTLAKIGAPIGGGSLMTAFRVKTRNGRDEVFKVLNPNAEYHLETVYKMLGSVMGALAESRGGGYGTAERSLADIKAWIGADIRFDGFLERDAAFRAQNHGFRPEEFRYSIKVPESFGPENRYFKREEYVDGINLTQPEELRAAGHDMKEIAGLIIANYMEQIQRGLVHSDVHPGNFRVTAGGEVAILDRNFFIELDERDKEFVMNLAGSFADADALTRSIADYLGITSRATVAAVRDRIAQLNESGMEALERVKALVIFLKEEGVRIPLKMTLLLKNINGLAGIAKMAGLEFPL